MCATESNVPWFYVFNRSIRATFASLAEESSSNPQQGCYIPGVQVNNEHSYYTVYSIKINK